MGLITALDQDDKPRRPKRRLTIEMVAMLLLGALVLTPALIVGMFAVKCTISFSSDFCTHSWGFKDWLTDTIPVLVAIIMRGGMSRPRDDD